MRGDYERSLLEETMRGDYERRPGEENKGVRLWEDNMRGDYGGDYRRRL